jgi:hypothetical protein
MPLSEIAALTRVQSEYSRREFLVASTALVFLGRPLAQSSSATREPVIDIHQHIVYNDRTVEQLIAHQRTMGVTTSVLMPTGDRGEGHPGGSGDHEAVLELCRTHPGEFVFFANEISDRAEAPKIIERQLRRGAIGIGEQKFRVDCDSPHIERIAEVARSFGVRPFSWIGIQRDHPRRRPLPPISHPPPG